MTMQMSYLGAADEPYILTNSDIDAEVATVSATNATTDNLIQSNKSKFTAAELIQWHGFSDEFIAWKTAWYKNKGLLSATSGNWLAARSYLSRALEWSKTVSGRLGIVIPGQPKPPLPPTSYTGYIIAGLGILGLVAVGYAVKSFGGADAVRAALRPKEKKAA